MNDDQTRELEKHHNRIDSQGNSTIKGTIPWLLDQISENLYRIDEELSPKNDRASKKRLKAILLDIRDQVRELRKRLD